MEAPETHDANPETAIQIQPHDAKDGSITFTVVMMLLALACVGITAAIAFHDMMAGG